MDGGDGAARLSGGCILRHMISTVFRRLLGRAFRTSARRRAACISMRTILFQEIINPDTGEVLPAGSKGELVFTTLTKEGLPLIRYRTRDITSLNYETCLCGRTFVRMNKPQGRSDDMLIIRGVNVFPSQIEDVLLKMGETAPYYMIIVDRVGTRDTLEIQVEVSDSMFSDAVRGIEELEKKIQTILRVRSVSRRR